MLTHRNATSAQTHATSTDAVGSKDAAASRLQFAALDGDHELTLSPGESLTVYSDDGRPINGCYYYEGARHPFQFQSGQAMQAGSDANGIPGYSRVCFSLPSGGSYVHYAGRTLIGGAGPKYDELAFSGAMAKAGVGGAFGSWATIGAGLQPFAGGLNTEMVQLVLDIVGTFDPTGVCDILSAGISAAKGEWLDVAASAVGIIPLIGDAVGKPFLIGKRLTKLGIYVDDITAFMSRAWNFLSEMVSTFVGKFRQFMQQGQASLDGFLTVMSSWFDDAWRRVSQATSFKGLHGPELFSKGLNYLPTSKGDSIKKLTQWAENVGAEIRSNDEAIEFLDGAARRYGGDPADYHAVTLGDIIMVRPEYAADLRVLTEELLHVCQQKGMTKATTVVEQEIEARLVMIANRNTIGLSHKEITDMIAEVRHMRATGRY
jgi:hypothetical protein